MQRVILWLRRKSRFLNFAPNFLTTRSICWAESEYSCSKRIVWTLIKLDCFKQSCGLFGLGSCRYAVCKLDKNWSSWIGAMIDGKCGQKQTRYRRYQRSWAYEEHTNACPPSLSQTCPQDMKETRQQCMYFLANTVCIQMTRWFVIMYRYFIRMNAEVI